MLTINLIKLKGYDYKALRSLLQMESTGNVRILIPRKVPINEKDLSLWYNEYCCALYIMHRLREVSKTVTCSVPQLFTARWFSAKLKKPLPDGLADILVTAIKFYQPGQDQELERLTAEAHDLWNKVIDNKLLINCPPIVTLMSKLRYKMYAQQAALARKRALPPGRQPI